MQLFNPVGFGFVLPSSYSSEDDPVYCFGEAVSLRVLYEGEALFDTDVFDR